MVVERVARFDDELGAGRRDLAGRSIVDRDGALRQGEFAGCDGLRREGQREGGDE